MHSEDSSTRLSRMEGWVEITAALASRPMPLPGPDDVCLGLFAFLDTNKILYYSYSCLGCTAKGGDGQKNANNCCIVDDVATDPMGARVRSGTHHSPDFVRFFCF